MMKQATPHYERCVLFCDHFRDDGGECCSPLGGQLRDQLKSIIAERGLKRRVRVSKSGCLGFCKNGPHVLIMPDNIWLSQVSEENIEDILALALKDIDEI